MKHFMRHFFRAMLRAEPKNILTSFDEANDETEQNSGNDGSGEFCEDDIPDFAIEASNVYRTKHFIVRQQLAYSKSELFGGLICSHDTYYLRTHERDLEYEDFFFDRLDLDGKRIPALMYSRKYID